MHPAHDPARGGMQVVPSSLRPQQWQNFTCLIDRLAAKARPCALELRLLHYIFSSGADRSALCAKKEDFIGIMRIIDLPGSMFPGLADEMRNSALPFKMWIVAGLMEEHAVNKLGVQVNFAPVVRGGLRAYGTRRVNGSGWEAVHASPFVVFIEEGEKKPAFPPAYLPPSSCLREVWLALCNKYDRLAACARGMEEKLFAESFLQLIGTLGVHPFMDANKRTFMAHLALTLERGGVRFRGLERAEALTKSLSEIHGDFIASLLGNAGLAMLSAPGEYARVVLDCSFREDYMRRLRGALMAAIDADVDPGGPYFGQLMRVNEAIRAEIDGSGRA